MYIESVSDAKNTHGTQETNYHGKEKSSRQSLP